MDLVITFFLFGGLTAMIAGTGAMFSQQFGLPALPGNLLMCAATAITVMTGLKGIINSISFVVPFLLVSVIAIGVASILNAPFQTAQAAANSGGLISNWFVSSVLYVSYNTVISIAVLGPLGVKAKNRSAMAYGALLGGLGLGICSFVIYFALAGRAPEIAGLEVPMLYIAGRISPVLQGAYAVILISEIYTTAVGSLYGLASRMAAAGSRRAGERTLILLASAAALVASRFGFSNLVKYLYPLVGYGGMVLLASLLYTQLAGSFRRVR